MLWPKSLLLPHQLREISAGASRMHGDENAIVVRNRQGGGRRSVTQSAGT